MAAAGTHGLQGAPPDYSTANDPQTLLWDIFTGLGIMAFAYGNTVLPGACGMFNTAPANPVAHRPGCSALTYHTAYLLAPVAPKVLICCGRDNVVGMLCSTAGHFAGFPCYL